MDENGDGSTETKNNETVSTLNEQEREMIVQAEESYSKSQFEDCLKSIQSLITSYQQKGLSNQEYLLNEAKLLMNKSLCNLASSKFEDLDEFKNELFNICSKVKLDLDKLESLDDANNAGLFFNYACYLYLTRDYWKCFKIVDKLYSQFRELLEPKLVRQVSILFADLLIHLRQPSKALSVLQNFEKTVFKRHSAEESLSSPESNVSSLSSSELQNYQQLVSMLKLKCYFQSNQSLEFEKELKSLAEQSLSSRRSHVSHFKSQEQFLQNDFIMSIKSLISNYLEDISNKEDINVQQLASIVQSEFNSSHFYLNLFNSITKATSSGVEESGDRVQLLNNLAINHFNMKKYSLGSLYLQKAMTENTKASRQYELTYNAGVSLLFSKQPVAAFECFYKLCSVYNKNARLWLRLAECCSMCYRHSINVDKESDVSTTNQFISFNSTPTANEKLFKLSEKIKCISKSFGQGQHHKIQLGSSLSREVSTARLLERIKLKDLGLEDNEASISKLITLDFAYICLRNALSLLPLNDKQFQAALKSSVDSSNSDSNEQVSADSEPSEDQDSETENKPAPGIQRFGDCVWPSKPINLPQLQNLRSSILVSLAYVSLTLKDYVNAIKYANMLLDSNDLFNLKYPISKGTKYLAHLYLSEALLCSDRVNESIENLTINTRIETDADISFVVPTVDIQNSQGSSYQRVNQTEWYPKDVHSAQAIAHYNLSVAHAARGEIEVAYKQFKTSVGFFNRKQPAHVFFMKLYLDLMDGSRQSLQEVLKDHFAHTTLNSSTPNINSPSASSSQVNINSNGGLKSNGGMPTPLLPQQSILNQANLLLQQQQQQHQSQPQIPSVLHQQLLQLQLLQQQQPNSVNDLQLQQILFQQQQQQHQQQNQFNYNLLMNLLPNNNSVAGLNTLLNSSAAGSSAGNNILSTLMGSSGGNTSNRMSGGNNNTSNPSVSTPNGNPMSLYAAAAQQLPATNPLLLLQQQTQQQRI